MAANDTAETDKLEEAGRILRGETRLLATIEHLNAMSVLIGRAADLMHSRIYCSPQTDPAVADWLREAAKVI